MGTDRARVATDAGEAEIVRLVREFESGEVGRFGHAEHLTVALWLLARLPAEEARERMRAGLKRLAALRNPTLYNETLTLFWLRLVRAFIEREGASHALPELARRLAAEFSDSRLVFDYYSREAVNTPEAKAAWTEPDLKPLDF